MPRTPIALSSTPNEPIEPLDGTEAWLDEDETSDGSLREMLNERLTD